MPNFTTVGELIEKLKEFPLDMKICGEQQGNSTQLAEKINLYESEIKINNDGYLESYDKSENWVIPVKVLRIDFDKY